MGNQNQRTAEQIQRIIARVVARNPAGNSLILIGGFRYRLLDAAPRVSEDIDYHWDKDFDAKQVELVDLLERKVLPEVKQRLNYDGDVHAATGENSDSPAVRVINAAFWQEGVPYSRIEVPVEVTSIVCLDPPIVRTLDGVVYPTPSDLDMIESKIIALLNRQYVRERDFVDVFLFSSSLTEESAVRLKEKLSRIGMTDSDAEKMKRRFGEYRTRHVEGIQAVMDRQVEPATVASLESAGGAEMIYGSVMELLEKHVPIAKGLAQ